MNLPRFVGPIVAVVLLGSVAGGVWYSHGRLAADSAQTARLQSEAAQELTVRGLIGSEKEAFFADSAVQGALARHHLTVVVEKAGSRAIAHQIGRASCRERV